MTKWITSEEFAGLSPLDLFGGHDSPDDRHLNRRYVFYRKFDYRGGEALADVTADDYYKLYVNGKKVAEGPAPGYPFAYYYNRVDLAPFLKIGENEIEVRVWYQGLCNRVFCSGDLRCGLWMRVFSGEKALLETDEDWEYAEDLRYTAGKIIGYKTAILENIDLYRGFSERKKAKYLQFDDHTLVLQETPCAIGKTVPFISVKKTDTGSYLFALPAHTAGTLRIASEGGKGRIRLLFGEELAENGHVRSEMRCLKTSCEEIWQLSGIDDAEQYDLHAFEFLEIEGEIDPRYVTFTERIYPAEFREFHSDDPDLDAVLKICRQAVINCSIDGFVDCPIRERGQYLGDLLVSAEAFYALTGDFRLFKKALVDFARSEQIAKGLLSCADCSFLQEIADYSLLFLYEIWLYYEESGDIDTVRDLFPTVVNTLKHFEKFARADGLLDGVSDKWNLVDWPANLRDDYDFELTKPVGPGAHNVLNAYYVGARIYAEKLAELLEIPFESRSDSLKKAFLNAFYDEKSHLFVDKEGSSHSSLHSNALPLFFGFARDPKAICELIREKELSCGVFFAYFVLFGLCRNGESALARELIIKDNGKSWKTMLNEGASACFEAWGKEQKANASLCHPWASTPLILFAKGMI